MDLIEVHAEIFSIAPTFVQRLMCHVIEVVSEEFARLIQCVTGFSTHGALQVNLGRIGVDTAERYRYWYRHGLSQQGAWVSFWTPKPLKSTH